LMRLFKRPPCPLCHDKKRKAKASRPYQGMVKCRNCGLIFIPAHEGKKPIIWDIDNRPTGQGVK
jgi:uncharacterized Zn finger protein